MQYSVFEQTLVTPDGVAYTAYGLRCALQPGDAAAIYEVGDISQEKSFVQALARLCTQGWLDPVHLADVAVDAALEPTAF